MFSYNNCNVYQTYHLLWWKAKCGELEGWPNSQKKTEAKSYILINLLDISQFVLKKSGY